MDSLSAPSDYVDIAGLALPTAVSAHVKWFCSYDVTRPPKAFEDVLNINLFLILGGFLTLLFLALLTDAWLVKHAPGLVSAGSGLNGA